MILGGPHFWAAHFLLYGIGEFGGKAPSRGTVLLLSMLALVTDGLLA